MSNYAEIEKFRRDPVATLQLVKRLMALPEGTLTAHEVAFLKDMRDHKIPRAIEHTRYHPLTTRQIEWLLAIRDSLKDHQTTPQGFSVPILIEQSWMNRHDLDDDEHIEFLERVRGSSSLKKRQLGLLLHISRKLGVIEEYV